MPNFHYNYPDGTAKSEAFEPIPIDTPQYLDDVPPHEPWLTDGRRLGLRILGICAVATTTTVGIIWWVAS